MAKPRKKIVLDLPVKDAKRDLVLHITPADIKGSKPGDGDYCAVANALCRQEKFKTARVHKGVTYVMHTDGTVTRYKTPQSLYVELLIFDRGGRMEPGEHKLQAPRGSERLGHHEKPKGPKARTGKPVRAVHLVKSVREDAPKGIQSLKALFE
jgi:hypothetical protein